MNIELRVEEVCCAIPANKTLIPIEVVESKLATFSSRFVGSERMEIAVLTVVFFSRSTEGSSGSICLRFRILEEPFDLRACRAGINKSVMDNKRECPIEYKKEAQTFELVKSTGITLPEVSVLVFFFLKSFNHSSTVVEGSISTQAIITFGETL